jgi:hypothetical protein
MTAAQSIQNSETAPPVRKKPGPKPGSHRQPKAEGTTTPRKTAPKAAAAPVEHAAPVETQPTPHYTAVTIGASETVIDDIPMMMRHIMRLMQLAHEINGPLGNRRKAVVCSHANAILQMAYSDCECTDLYQDICNSDAA